MNEKTLSFGRYLMGIRLQKSISLSYVSKVTKIGVDTLLTIENEEHSRLPAEVFVKGFLRSYAKAVGANGDEAVIRYNASREAFRKLMRPEFNLDHINSRFWLRATVSFGAFALLISAVSLLS